MRLSSGTRFGTYEILALLGAGGMGEVYRARDTRLKRDVAIKVLQGAWVDTGDRLARFEREAELLAALNHPNIAADQARGTPVGEPFIVQHLHDPTRRWGSRPFGNAIASNAFVFSQVEMTGSIWLLGPGQ